MTTPTPRHNGTAVGEIVRQASALFDWMLGKPHISQERSITTGGAYDTVPAVRLCGAQQSQALEKNPIRAFTAG